MIWDQILSGVLLVVRSEFAIMQFHHIGLPALSAFLIVTIWTNFKVILLFTSVSLVDWLVVKTGNKHQHLGEIILNWSWLKKIDQAIRQGKKRLLAWLLIHNKLVIFLILFIPFTPFMEDVAIVAAKIARIKKALPLLIIANTSRMALMIFLIYYCF
jgi:hypothetical protein